jgi:hypothetical protein
VDVIAADGRIHVNDDMTTTVWDGGKWRRFTPHRALPSGQLP